MKAITSHLKSRSSITGLHRIKARVSRAAPSSSVAAAPLTTTTTTTTTLGTQQQQLLHQPRPPPHKADIPKSKLHSNIQHKSFHSTLEKRNANIDAKPQNHNNKNNKNLSRDTRMAGRRRFYKTVDVKAIPPPWHDLESGSSGSSTVENPISAGVDGTNSATNISLDKPSAASMKLHLTPSSSNQDINHDTNPVQWYGITLDGRILKTPMGTTLSVPSLTLALSIASEWDDQASTIQPAQMPLMTLACTTIDQFTIPSVRSRIVDDILRYLKNDTTCYWSDPTEDRVLYRKQKKYWDGLHRWVDCEVMGLGLKPAVAMGAGEGLVMSRSRRGSVGGKPSAGLPHDEEIMVNARLFLEQCDAWTLAAMQSVTMEAKSFLVGMAVVRSVHGNSGVMESVVEGKNKAQQAKKNPFVEETKQAVMASRVEEEFQIDNWGLVEGGHDYDRLNCSIQIHAATSLLQSIALDNRN